MEGEIRKITDRIAILERKLVNKIVSNVVILFIIILLIQWFFLIGQHPFFEFDDNLVYLI